MKKGLTLLLLTFSFLSYSQEKFIPAIKQGSKLRYNVVTSGGQDVPLLITLDSITADYMKWAWTIEGFGNGGWIMRKKSIEGATKGAWEEPTVGTDQELADEKAVLMFSKAQWASIQKDNKADFDMQNFAVKSPSGIQLLKVSGKVIDAILLEAQNGTRIWILNNPTFPLLLKIEGNTIGPDLEIRSVE